MDDTLSKSFPYGKSIKITDGSYYFRDITFDLSQLNYASIESLRATISFKLSGNRGFVRDTASGQVIPISSALGNGTYEFDVITQPSLSNWSSYPIRLYVVHYSDGSGGTVTYSDVALNVYYELIKTPITDPSAVSLASNVAQTSSVMSWIASQDGTANHLTGYQIQYSLDGSSWSDLISVGVVDNAQVQPKSERSAKTYYRIRGIGTGGQRYASNWVRCAGYLTRNALPDAPSGLSTFPAVFENDSIQIGWQAAHDQTDAVQSYKVYKTTDSGQTPTYTLVTTVQDDGSLRYDIDVSPGVGRGQYVRFGVSSVDVFGCQSQVSLYTSGVKNAAPTVPQSVASNKYVYESGTVTVSWNASTDQTDSVAGYQVFRRNSTVGDSWQSVTTTSLTSYVSSDFGSRGDLIQFRVRAYDSFGVYSDYSQTVGIRHNVLPTAPTQYKLQLPVSVGTVPLYESGNIKMTWNNSASSYSTITGYELMINNGSQTKRLAVATSSPYQIQIPLSDFARGVTASFCVRALDSAGGVGPVSNSVTIIRNSVPGSPTLVYPSSSIHSSTPYLVIDIDNVQDGKTRKLQIYKNSWVDLGSYGSQAQRIIVKSVQLASGQNSIQLRVTDVFGVSSPNTSVTITVQSAGWSRAISTGSVIANTSISHRADFTQLMQKINSIRSAYGLSASSFTSTPGLFAQWYKHMSQAFDAIQGVYSLFGEVNTMPQKKYNGYPDSSLVNYIRALVQGV